jgi:alanyl-tRNA synthetase
VATERLYQRDPYRIEFDALVIESLTVDGQPAVILNATCFYPTSGGQPHDTGSLAGSSVIDVVEVGDRVVHVLTTPVELGLVHGSVDWPRRFDHMQQHTGQHILSQAFERILGAETVSFHLGSAVSTIDLALAALDVEAMHEVEDLANRVVLENRPIDIREYEESAISALHLRKPPVVHGLIRVVAVADFDTSACGGTHLRSSGELGSILIRRWERRRGQIRVEFLCGWRALHDHRALNRIAHTLASQLSTAVEDAPATVAKLVEAGQAHERQVSDLCRRLVDCEIPALLAEARDSGCVVRRVLHGYDVNTMRYAAQRLTQEAGIVALLGVTEPAPQVCFARSADLPGHMGQLLRSVLAPFGGRGGGEAHIAQGGGFPAADIETVLQVAHERLRSLSA